MQEKELNRRALFGIAETRCRMTSAQREELVDIDRLRCTCLSVWLLQNEGVLIGQ